MYNPDDSGEPGPSDVYRTGRSSISVRSSGSSPSISGSDHEKNVRAGYLSVPEVIEIDTDSEPETVSKKPKVDHSKKRKPAPKSVQRRRATSDFTYHSSSESDVAPQVAKKRPTLPTPAEVQQDLLITDSSDTTDYNYGSDSNDVAPNDPLLVSDDEEEVPAMPDRHLSPGQNQFVKRMVKQKKVAGQGLDSASGAAPLPANPRQRNAHINVRGRAVNSDGTPFQGNRAPGKRPDPIDHPHIQEIDRDMPRSPGA